MKRLLVLGLALVTFLVPAAAVADSGTTLAGTAEWSTDATAIHGTFDGKLGKGTYAGTLEGGAPFTSGDCGPVCRPVTGTITFSANRGTFTGVVQPGSVVALQDIASHSWRNFTLTLDVVDGTRGYAHADGVLSLSYTSDWSHFFDFDKLEFVSFIADSGTLTGNLR